MTDDEASPSALVHLTFGFMATHAVHTAVELGVLDAFDAFDGLDSGQLAARLSLPAATTVRLLRALAALGLLTETERDVFRPTATGRLLRADHPNSMRSFVAMFGDPVMQRAWERLPDSVRTGQPAFDDVFGAPFFPYLQGKPDKAELFNQTMSVVSDVVAADLAGAFPFAQHQTLVDVGGGDGTTLATVLAAHPTLHGIVFDSEAGAAQAPDVLAARGIDARAKVATGDFFATVPAGGDLYLLKNVLHDWDDEPAERILRNCRAEIPSGGRLLIVEPTLPEMVSAGAPAHDYLDDLNMMVNLGGRTRTRREFDRVCAAAGFQLTDARPIADGIAWLFEARPA